MLRWIVGSSLKFRYLVVAIAAALMFFGVQQLQNRFWKTLINAGLIWQKLPETKPGSNGSLIEMLWV